MALPTVRDVWRLALPTTARLVGGEIGLGNSVAWARRMAVYAPAFGSLEAGDIALLSMEALSLVDERLTFARVLEALASRGASAVGVVGHPSAAAVTASDSHGLPLFALSTDTDLRDIERDIILLIVEHEVQVQKRGKEIYQRLMRTATGRRGLAGIAEELMSITGGPIAILDSWTDTTTTALPPDCPWNSEVLGKALAGGARLRDPLRPAGSGRALSCVPVPVAQCELLVCSAPIIIEGDVGGLVSLLSEASPDDLDRLCLEQGALASAVEIAKQRAVAAAEDRLRGGFLDALMTAPPSGQGVLARRAGEMGYDLGGHHCVCILSLTPQSAHTLALLASEFRAGLLNSRMYAFLCPYEGNLAVLCRADEAAILRQVDELANEARLSTRNRLAGTAEEVHIAIGIGNPGVGLTGLRQSLVEAQESLSLGRHVSGGDRVVAFRDLGAYSLLHTLQGSAELQAFHDRTLGPLARYDAAHNSRLVDTLEAYLDHLGNVSQTAESLYLHRNSLLYRLERISEITGFDLNDADDRFSLQLALRTRAFLNQAGGAE